MSRAVGGLAGRSGVLVPFTRMAIAGWLFADLLLVLFLAALGSVPPAPAGAIAPSPSAEPTPSTEPSATPCPQANDLHKYTFTIDGVSLTGLTSGDAAAERTLLSQLDRQIRQQGLADRYAGLVLTFGVAPNSQRDNARAAARSAGNILKKSQVKFRTAVVEAFNYEANFTNRLILDVYFLIPC